jgi:hypothetical protein
VSSARSVKEVLTFRRQSEERVATAVIDPAAKGGDDAPTLVVTADFTNVDVAEVLAPLIFK